MTPRNAGQPLDACPQPGRKREAREDDEAAAERQLRWMRDQAADVARGRARRGRHDLVADRVELAAELLDLRPR